MITYLPVGRFAIPPDDSLHLNPYDVPPKTLILDGTSKIDFSAMPSEDYGRVFAAGIDQARSESTYVNLAVDSAYVDSVQGLLVVRITADTVEPGEDLRLIAVLTEDSVATNAHFPVVFDRVARKFMPNEDGLPISVTRFDTLYDTLRFTSTGFRASKLGAAIFVEDASDHTIVQATELWRFP